MKRLVFCFDGTWNKLDAPAPTNVVFTAQSISPVAKGGITQIIHYDQGVGTAKGTYWSGGLFGEGLLDKIVDAYTFLVFNYQVGDEIYVFGFSRGAYTARSFVGLLRTVGVLRRANAGEITSAVQQYKRRKVGEDHDSEEFLKFRLKSSPDVCVDEREDAWRCINHSGYKSGSSPILRIRYLGVWDTVGSLGIPNNMLLAPFINKGTIFHDTELSDLVVSARHAVAIDEMRKSFAPTLWTNFEELNRVLGYASSDEHAPYQQKWFPGTHGSVGGGGLERGLSDFAMEWIVQGARNAGLQLDTDASSRIYGLSPNYLAPLVNIGNVKKGIVDYFMKLLPAAPRLPGPDTISNVSRSAIARWGAAAGSLPEGVLYRPKTLARVSAKLDQVAQAGDDTVVTKADVAAVPTPDPVANAYYKVVRGDTLTGIAQKAYKAASKYDRILAANSGLLEGPDHIYVGQILYIPPDV